MSNYIEQKVVDVFPNPYSNVRYLLFVKEVIDIKHFDIDGLVQECSISSALTMMILQPYTKSSTY